MRRKLSNLLAAVSLLLFLVTGLWWVRSDLMTEIYQWNRTGSKLVYHNSAVLSGLGVLQFAREDSGYPIYLAPRSGGYKELGVVQRFDPSWIASSKQGWGFAGLSVNRAGSYVLLVTVPYWMVLVATGLWPAAWLMARVRGRGGRFSSGRCETCGYDLRATPDRCPECGAVPKLVSAAAASTAAG